LFIVCRMNFETAQLFAFGYGERRQKDQNGFVSLCKEAKQSPVCTEPELFSKSGRLELVVRKQLQFLVVDADFAIARHAHRRFECIPRIERDDRESQYPNGTESCSESERSYKYGGREQ